MPYDSRNGTAKRERIGLFLVVVAAFGFGISPSYAKLAYEGGAEPLTLVAARFTICVLIMSIVAKVRQTSIRVSGKLLYLPLIMGLLLAWNATGYLSAVKEIKVSLAAALFYTFPLQVAVFSWMMGFELLSMRRIAALSLGFVGVLFVISLGLSEMNIYGIVLALGAGCGVALTSVLFSRAADINNSVALMFWSMVVACLFSWLVTFLLGDFALPHTRGGWNGFLVSMLGFFLIGHSVLPRSSHDWGNQSGNRGQLRTYHCSTYGYVNLAGTFGGFANYRNSADCDRSIYGRPKANTRTWLVRYPGFVTSVRNFTMSFQ